jgi:hypothetical protein
MHTATAIVAVLSVVGPPALAPAHAAGDVSVVVSRVPDGGIQPQVASGPDGTIHLVYFKGEARAGDLFYATRGPGKVEFTAAVRVNSEAGSACAAGTIRGAQIAIGRNGRVHAAWNGSDKAATKPAEGKYAQCPMLYTSLDPATGRFEPQRNLMTATTDLDGGGTIAADAAGGVVVAWHGHGPGAKEDGEAGRRVWVARSSDDGTTFSPEAAVDPGRGACACCGMAAMTDDRGRMFLMYRAAGDGIDRGMVLLSTPPGGRVFGATDVDQWRVQTCPMSSGSLREAAGGVWLGWENKGQVFFATYDADNGKISPPRTPPGESRTRKHPRLAANRRGEVLLVWTDGTGWQKGGSLAWQVFDVDGRPIDGGAGKADGVQVWSFGGATARPDGVFEIFY